MINKDRLNTVVFGDSGFWGSHVADAAESSIEILDEKFRNEHVIFTGNHPMKVSELFIIINEILKKDIEFEFITPKSKDPIDHYTITPYTFIPTVGKKYVRYYYTDMGQGLLMCMDKIFNHTHKNKNNDIQLPS